MTKSGSSLRAWHSSSQLSYIVAKIKITCYLVSDCAVLQFVCRRRLTMKIITTKGRTRRAVDGQLKTGEVAMHFS